MPDEIRNLALGYWGRTPGPVDPNILDRIGEGRQPIGVRPGDMIPPGLANAREQLGSGLSDEDLLLGIFYMPSIVEDLKKTGRIPTANPLAGGSIVDVVRHVAASGARCFSLVQP